MILNGVRGNPFRKWLRSYVNRVCDYPHEREKERKSKRKRSTERECICLMREMTANVIFWWVSTVTRQECTKCMLVWLPTRRYVGGVLSVCNIYINHSWVWQPQYTCLFKWNVSKRFQNATECNLMTFDGFFLSQARRRLNMFRRYLWRGGAFLALANAGESGKKRRYLNPMPFEYNSIETKVLLGSFVGVSSRSLERLSAISKAIS